MLLAFMLLSATAMNAEGSTSPPDPTIITAVNKFTPIESPIESTSSSSETIADLKTSTSATPTSTHPVVSISTTPITKKPLVSSDDLQRVLCVVDGDGLFPSRRNLIGCRAPPGFTIYCKSASVDGTWTTKSCESVRTGRSPGNYAQLCNVHPMAPESSCMCNSTLCNSDGDLREAFFREANLLAKELASPPITTTSPPS